jgi:hypothetical protein
VARFFYKSRYAVFGLKAVIVEIDIEMALNHMYDEIGQFRYPLIGDIAK